MGNSRTRCFVCERWVDHCTCSDGPTTLNPAFKALVSSDIEKGALEAEIAALRAQVEELKRELTKVREAAALLVGQTLQRAEKAEAERDKALGMAEKPAAKRNPASGGERIKNIF